MSPVWCHPTRSRLQRAHLQGGHHAGHRHTRLCDRVQLHGFLPPLRNCYPHNRRVIDGHVPQIPSPLPLSRKQKRDPQSQALRHVSSDLSHTIMNGSTPSCYFFHTGTKEQPSGSPQSQEDLLNQHVDGGVWYTSMFARRGPIAVRFASREGQHGEHRTNHRCTADCGLFDTGIGYRRSRTHPVVVWAIETDGPIEGVLTEPDSEGQLLGSRCIR